MSNTYHIWTTHWQYIFHLPQRSKDYFQIQFSYPLKCSVSNAYLNPSDFEIVVNVLLEIIFWHINTVKLFIPKKYSFAFNKWVLVYLPQICWMSVDIYQYICGVISYFNIWNNICMYPQQENPQYFKSIFSDKLNRLILWV